jgi:hypothetical protein
MTGISVDLDSVAAHLRGYGLSVADDDGANYRLALPRALQLFEAMGARATFFLVAAEAASFPETVRAIVAAGHEVACHSMTHAVPLPLTDRGAVQRETAVAKALLESLSGGRVAGFRTPSWGVSPELFEALGRAGYRYDASSFPSWVLYLARRSVARRSGQPGAAGPPASLRQMLLEPAVPHRVATSAGELVEIPVSTVPFIRFPYYHTLRFVLPAAVFQALAAAVRMRRGPLTYAFHAVDFLEVAADGLDPRIGRHPGMGLPLVQKLRLARESLARLQRSAELLPLRSLAEAVLER